MKNNLTRLLSLLLAVLLMTTVAAAYTHPDPIAPGDTYSLDKSELYDRDGNAIPGDVTLNNTNFSIYRKSISKGANLVREIKINNRTQQVQIIFASGSVSAAPKSPNVVIDNLSVRAIRNVRDSDRNILVADRAVFEHDGNLRFSVGLETEEQSPYKDGVDIDLESGDQQYVRWSGGDSYGTVRVNYGSLAYAEGRVYEDDKNLYYFSDEVDSNLEDANPSAYISAVNMGNGSYPNGLTVQLLANKSDYIYEYAGGKLSATTLKWSEDDYAWVGKVTKGKHYVVSDTRLRGASGATGGDSSSSNDADNSYDNPYDNPDTGAGSNLAVTISAIVAIVAISVVSIIMSTIVTVKKK